MKEIGIYVHIPFCKRKCYYCDFCSFEIDKNVENEYVEALLCEIRAFDASKIKELINKEENNNFQKNNYANYSCADNMCKIVKEDFKVKTLYIGGGTPSIINEKSIGRVIKELRDKFYFDKNPEITIEVNPGTASYDKLKYYKEIGINRLSIGLQSTQDRLLELIGRIHSYKEFEEVYKMARSIGFDNINVDLMIGLPTQTKEDVLQSLNKIIEKNPEHISVYSLILEDGTRLKKLVDNKVLKLPDDDLERYMYWLVKNTLEHNGYKHYEISNFAKNGYLSKHNSDCWKQKEYIGFGVSAHSYCNNIRYSNTCNFNEYIKNIGANNIDKIRQIEEIQDLETKINEYVILQLRTIDGINIAEFKRKFNVDIKEKFAKQIDKLVSDCLLFVDNEWVKLTSKGIDFANVVWGEFL